MTGEERPENERPGEDLLRSTDLAKMVLRAGAQSGIYGMAAGAVKGATKKWGTALVAILLLPVVLVAMLPSIILGPLYSIGTEIKSGMVDGSALTARIEDLNAAISASLSEGIANVHERIEADFAASGCDEKEIINPYSSGVTFNANAIVSQYCAYQDSDARKITTEELITILKARKQHMYSFTYKDETRSVSVDELQSNGAGKEKKESQTIRVRVYTISYNGEAYFANHVFGLDEKQKELAQQYAQNLTLLMSDGVYQGLTESEITGGASYEGVTFTDGSTHVTYFNQLDERWKNLPYGTDHIGGYACGPTAMSIVVSSLTTETIDPPHMAKWAYEHGYWCSGSGSYHSLIPGASREWGLHVEGCTVNEPQRIVDALSEGKLVVAIMGKGHFTKSGHFIVLRGVKTNGTILVADPSSYRRSQKEWDLEIILNEAGKRVSSGGPFWIIGN